MHFGRSITEDKPNGSNSSKPKKKSLAKKIKFLVVYINGDNQGGTTNLLSRTIQYMLRVTRTNQRATSTRDL
jgi:hypothetical protein